MKITLEPKDLQFGLFFLLFGVSLDWSEALTSYMAINKTKTIIKQHEELQQYGENPPVKISRYPHSVPALETVFVLSCLSMQIHKLPENGLKYAQNEHTVLS